MEIKAVFLDIDGTFFDHVHNKVLPETLAACKELKKCGYKVALCSGRPKEMAEQLHVFDMMKFDGYIGCAGGVIYDEKGMLIHEDAYSHEQLQQIFQIGKEHDLCLYSFGKYEFMTKPLNELSKRLIEEFHLSMPKVSSWHGEALSAVSVLSEHEEDFHLFDDIDNISQTSSASYCRDFIRNDVNKATGIAHLMKHWHFPIHAYMAFGDSLNDMEMIQQAEIGVAMGNGHEEIKKIANIVCGPSHEPSIANTLHTLHIL